MTEQTGNRYEGEFREGRRDGRGVMTSAEDYRYNGEWKDGLENGQGVLRKAYGIDMKENSKMACTMVEEY